MMNDIETTLIHLRAEFIAQLPTRIHTMEKLLETLSCGEKGAACTLHHTAHSLVGAAGIHRLMAITDAAKKLEALTASLPPEGKVTAPKLFALHKALARVGVAAENPTHDLSPSPAARSCLRVMIVDSDVDQALWLRSVLEDTGYQVDVFNQLSDCREAFAHGDKPAIVIMEMAFPEGGNAGAEFLAQVKKQQFAGASVIFLSARQDIEAKLAAYRAGATHYLTKPVERNVLLRAISGLAGFAPTRPYRVLVVDDEPDQLATHALILRQAGMTVLETTNPLEVPDLLDGFAAEAMVLDMVMPQCSGAELATILHGDGRHDHIPIVYLSTKVDCSRQFMALGQCGDHFLTKPVEPFELATAVALHAGRFRQTREQLETLSTTLYERERQQHALDAHTIVSISDPAGNIIYANDKFCKVSGYSRQELLGENHRILKSGMHPAEFYAGMWRTLMRGVIWHGVICNQRKDGSLYWVESSIVPFMDATGKPYQYIAIRTDISHVKEPEQRLSRSQIYANIGTWDWNIKTGGLYWSERISPLFGYLEGELETTYENFLAAVHPDDRQQVIDAVSACVERGVEYNVEHRCVWPDGAVHWLLERGDVMRDVEGNAMHMLGVVQDITERKLTEIALKESRTRLEVAQSLAKLGNWEANITNGKLHWSDEIFRIFGHDPGSFTPSVEAFMQAVHPDDVELVRESERRAAQTGVHDIVHRILRPSGEVRYVHELAQAQTNAGGHLMRMTGTVQDVTELKQAEHAMLLAKEAAEAASLTKSDFLASMSHELRTPLNSILGFAQLFGMDLNLPKKTKQYANEIERAGQHLLSLVNDLIDLARIEAGKLELFPAPVSVKAVVGDSLSLVAPIAKERGIRLVDADGDGRDALVRADYTRLQQVLINLLANAIKYNRPAGVVHLACHTGNGMVRISITDSGLGIPAHKQSRMFSPFDRLGAERGEIEGSGIGLVITKRIVEAMGGSIGFESIEGKGSTFWAEFATIEATERSAPSPDTKRAKPPERARAVRAHVLYIEDNPMNQRLMQQIFAVRKHLDLSIAHSAEIGIQLARTERPALILMDINLSGMDGYAALSILKAEPETAGIPVIAVSANAMKGEEARGLRAGFVSYLTKPIDIPLLFRVVDGLLQKTGGDS